MVLPKQEVWPGWTQGGIPSLAVPASLVLCYFGCTELGIHYPFQHRALYSVIQIMGWGESGGGEQALWQSAQGGRWNQDPALGLDPNCHPMPSQPQSRLLKFVLPI